jgi:hypothetical protein
MLESVVDWWLTSHGKTLCWRGICRGAFCGKNDGPVLAVGRRAAGQPIHIATYTHMLTLPLVNKAGGEGRRRGGSVVFMLKIYLSFLYWHFWLMTTQNHNFLSEYVIYYNKDCFLYVTMNNYRKNLKECYIIYYIELYRAVYSDSIF